MECQHNVLEWAEDRNVTICKECNETIAAIDITKDNPYE